MTDNNIVEALREYQARYSWDKSLDAISNSTPVGCATVNYYGPSLIQIAKDQEKESK